MMDSNDERIACLYISLFSPDLLCNLRFLELQEPIEDIIGRKSLRDTAYQHRDSRRKEGAKSLNSPYTVLGNPNQGVMTLAIVRTHDPQDIIEDLILN